MDDSKYYAKVRKQQILNHYGKPQHQYVLEIRDISEGAEIKAKIPPERFDSKEDAAKFAREKGFLVTKTWYWAEEKEMVYRDGTQNKYRSRVKVQFTDEDKKAGQEIWAQILAKEEAKKKAGQSNVP